MSGGRVELGLGAAWYTQEHAWFGIPFPPLGERFDRLEEQLQIVTGLWTTPEGEPFGFAGRHYRLEGARNFPRPAQTPRPPIIVGGGGPRRTPTLAARFADEFNGGFGDGLPERFARFRRICEATGRDPATVTLSAVLPVFCGSDEAEAARRSATMAGHVLQRAAACGRPDTVVARVEDLAEAGAQTVYFHLFDVDDVDHVRLLGDEVLPRFAPAA